MLLNNFKFELIDICNAIKELPILKFCKHISGRHPSPELYEFPTPDGLIVALQKLYPEGEIILDCALFSQLYAYYTIDPMKTEYTFILGLPINYTTLFNYEFYKLFYLLPTDQQVASDLQKFQFVGKGQWLVYDGGDKYIGLCSYGVVKKSLEWWINKCITTCVKYSETPAENIRQIGEKGIISIYIKTSRLKKWHIECNNIFEESNLHIEHNYKEDQVIKKYNFIKNEKIILKNIPNKNNHIKQLEAKLYKLQNIPKKNKNNHIKQPRSKII